MSRKLSKILYTFLLQAVFLFAFPIPSDLDTDSPENIYHTSRVLIGEGARVIIDKEASAKIWYDDVVLLMDGKLQEMLDIHGETNLTNKDDDSSSEDSGSIPTELMITKAYPNPFNPTVSISYGLPSNSDVRILIHDLSGRKITEYNQNGKTAGWHNFKWDATDVRGNGIGSGIYLMTIQASDMVQKQKLTFIK